MIIDWATIIEKIPELGMVIVVAWFALRMADTNQKYISGMSANWKTFYDEQSKDWRNYIERQEVRFVKSMDNIVAKLSDKS